MCAPSSSASAQSDRSTKMHHLPAELRVIIYRMLVHSSSKILVEEFGREYATGLPNMPQQPHLPRGLLGACQESRAEAIKILFRENTFAVDTLRLSPDEWLSFLGPYSHHVARLTIPWASVGLVGALRPWLDRPPIPFPDLLRVLGTNFEGLQELSITTRLVSTGPWLWKDPRAASEVGPDWLARLVMSEKLPNLTKVTVTVQREYSDWHLEIDPGDVERIGDWAAAVSQLGVWQATITTRAHCAWLSPEKHTLTATKKG